ncbi:MAG TPA: ribokinase [Spirochaetota bacterium]|nr:ribokinase [Spirochaetota bacterium]
MKVLNFGSLNIDKVYKLRRFPLPGETITSLDYNIFPGGKGLNQSIALQKTGVEVAHAGKVGADGQILLAALEENNINTGSITAAVQTDSGHAVIFLNEQKENMITLYQGANHQITLAEINRVFKKFTKNDVLVLQNEINNLPAIIKKAAARKMKIVFNPAPMLAAVKEYPLELVDLFILNETEAAALCNCQHTEAMPAALADFLPGKIILLTLGTKGVYYIKDRKKIHQPAFKVKVCDTTAAGDTFCGFFTGLYFSGRKLDFCLQYAAAAAALAVSRPGAATSIPDLKEVKKFLADCSRSRRQHIRQTDS